MADERKDGGPAFPAQVDRNGQPVQVGNNAWLEPGMSLRDYFAGQAAASGQCPVNQHEHAGCATWAYQRADALLKEREK